ncbi:MULTISPECIES: TetR/AcrR family transcriptional regulator [Nocardiaceae]|uniref:AcrR family transcriptional regulator n=1 Tax=Rhodococcoides corynebacterioides TaxID=53972 RepID=A0ABS2KYL8_9NOCA|nr:MULTISPECIES: TetR/AcrR family transcriptional regulator [Rhodococcus]MBM7417019.1 AcrR family transcriptional regulator [Rhodococcus corynebacterioides]MBP1115272.1 AcrR family transcriptional regulator [Rhodococcus sp. PvP016]
MPTPEEPGPDTRARILIAACEMIGEDPASTLSVRSVAARAGVSMGSLRHHFPTQRALREAVLATIYDVVTPDADVIHDRSIPARDRLVRCLEQVLVPAVGAQARRALISTVEAFAVPEPTADIRAAYASFAEEAQRRVEQWLDILVAEGAAPQGDQSLNAAFLNTVLDGLFWDRAMPTDPATLHRATAILQHAVDSVLTPP